jgi:hypothetical protein
MRLIFLSDSRQQWSGKYMSKVPALHLYHDERFVAVRKALEDDKVEDLRVVIISAKYGLIDPYRQIRAYGNGLTYEKVDHLMPAFRKQWEDNAEKWFEDVDELFVAAQGPYLYVLQRLEMMIKWTPLIESEREGIVQYMYQPFQVSDWIQRKQIFQEF